MNVYRVLPAVCAAFLWMWRQKSGRLFDGYVAGKA